MARTRSQDHDLVKQTILDSAARLFATRGFASASMNEIAAGAGISKAGIYHYFDSKSEILRVMLTEHLESVADIADAALNSSDSPRAKFVTFTRMMIESYTRSGSASRHHHTVVMRDLDALPARDREFVISAERRIIRAVERLLQNIQPELKDRPELVRPLTMLFFGMINWTDNWYSEKGHLSPEELASLAAEVFLQGVERMRYAEIRTERPRDRVLP